jgi:hypothetical protein
MFSTRAKAPIGFAGQNRGEAEAAGYFHRGQKRGDAGEIPPRLPGISQS